MAVIVVIPSPDHAENLLQWANVMKEPDAPLEIICLDPEGSSETYQTVQEYISDADIEFSTVSSIRNTAPLSEILERTRKLKARLLITGQFLFRSIVATETIDQTSEELVRSAPCTAAYFLSGAVPPKEIKKVLMVVNQSTHDMGTLRVTENLNNRLKSDLTLATVEQMSTSKAEISGEIAIRSLVHDFGVDLESVHSRVIVDRLRHRGIRKCIEDEQLIVTGFDCQKNIMPLRQSLDDRQILVIKPSSPVRLTAYTEWLPKINPRDHAELLQDLRHGSRWNKDFVSMLSLAAAIAALGLLQDSPAVVIGSMLLAPLMTPMIGLGLALAQANVELTKRCAVTILKGIVLTFVVSLAVGLITPARETLSPEVTSRGSPNILDLLIALGAAIAATIAMSRPNIGGAVAGVAIATALVPPLCAVGISVSVGQFLNASGALILFTTNLIAIVVASSVTFALMGIVAESTLPRYKSLARSLQISLIALLIVLAGPLSVALMNQLEKGRPQTAFYPVTRAVSRALRSRVDKDEGIEIVLMGRASVKDVVIIYIAANHEVPESYADELVAIVRKEMFDPDLEVYVACLSGQWLSSPD